MPDQKIVIIGAGLAGSLLSIYLAKRGTKVDVYEARGDMRKVSTAAGRSINLALSDRGIAALREVGMDEYMLAEAVPMHGRMIHSPTGNTKLLPYSGRQGEYINSVSRAGLNIALMNEAEKYGGVTLHFDERCLAFDCESGTATFSSGKEVTADTVIATDGAGSAVRQAMMNGGIDRFDFSQSWLEHGYKELHIPPYFTPDAMKHIVELGFKHLLVDLPSIDRLFDDGKLTNHRIFWKVDAGSREVNADTRRHSTITELIYVPNEIEDGEYLLNLQIAPFESDCAPSRPILLRAT